VVASSASRPTAKVLDHVPFERQVGRTIDHVRTLWSLAQRAATGLDVPIERGAVADAPYFYEDRIRRALPRLKKLRMIVPERHDLALMKVVRGDRHDIDVIAEIHTKHPLKLATLVKRFEEEMGHVIKYERTLRLQFRLLIEQLFGKEAARSIRATRVPGSGGHRV
jgi:hypothetical protein